MQERRELDSREPKGLTPIADRPAAEDDIEQFKVAVLAKLTAALGATDLAGDPRYADNPSRVRHRDELVAARLEERIGGHHDRGNALLRNSFKCCVEIAISAGVEHMKLLTDSAPRFLQIS